MAEPGWRSWAATDAGLSRDGNEDAFVDRTPARFWAVADGAGGHEDGWFASSALRTALEQAGAAAHPAAEVRARVAAVHQALLDRAGQLERERGASVVIASTVVVLCAVGPAWSCLWCGDSRAYLLRAGALTRLSRDHSVVQDLVDAGVVREADADRHPVAHLLTRAVGARGQSAELDEVAGLAQPGDRFVLCSDGLSKTLDDAAMAGLAAAAEPARALIEAALARRAEDNATAVVVEWSAGPEPGNRGFIP